ncbi:MAG: hypothetical protein ACR2NA_03025 [Solirubrobacterales bacterium]
MSATLRAPAHPLRIVALGGLGAGVIALTIRLSMFFDRGSWLVAYLLLVGFLAPLLLARGQRRLDPYGECESLQAALWALGVVAVPAGVFADARLLVVVGAVALWGSLAVMAQAAFAPARAEARTAVPHRWPHPFLMAVMAISAGIGLALAWDRPWI